jgi:hypothetical protein
MKGAAGLRVKVNRAATTTCNGNMYRKNISLSAGEPIKILLQADRATIEEKSSLRSTREAAT